MPTTTDLIRRRQARHLRARQGTQRTLRSLSATALTLVAGFVLIVLAVFGVLASIYAYFTRDLPPASTLQAIFDSTNSDFFRTTQIYDRTDTHLLYEVIDPRGGDRQYTAYADLPLNLISATIAIEDKTFFTNPGYDAIGIVRALVSNVRGEAIQGGSSITQQLVKNTLIPIEERAERSYSRKIREILLAAEITRRYSKEQILEWYLNTNFYGSLAYGVDAAALVYFGKHAQQLTLAEAALLAAIPNSPGLNPNTAPEEAKRRQEVVLDVMAHENFISPAEAETAKAAPLSQPPVQRFDIKAPHFSIYARQQVIELLNALGLEGEDLVNRGGLRIVTTLDWALQQQAECVARTQVARLSGSAPDVIVPVGETLPVGVDCAAAEFLPPLREADVGIDHHVTNAAIVALRPTTGEIMALVGSLDYWNPAIAGNFNIAVDGQRQPGSSFKPFTYLEAFRAGYSPATMLLDIRTVFPTLSGEAYVPENYDRRFHGPVSMREALARSYNIPAVQTLNLVGIDNVIRRAHQMGINSLETGQYGLALTLGGGEVTLLDMAYAFGVFANSGVMAGQPVPLDEQRPGFRQLDPISILRVTDNRGQVLYELRSPSTQPILSPELAYLMNDVLSDNAAREAAFGRDNPLTLPDRPVGAKTGTTNDFRDNWTVGYAPQLAVGVWVGNADNTPMQSVTGLTGAAPIWHAVMRYGTQALPPQGWTQPPGIVSVKVCVPSGKLPTEFCPRTRDELFIRGAEPTDPDNVWQAVTINRDTGKRATVCTPPELLEEKVYEILPPEAADWVRTVGVPQPPTEYDTLTTACLATSNVAILDPQPFAYIHGTVIISGTSKGDNYAFFRVEYGPGLYPQGWTQIEGDRGEQIENGVLQTWNTAGLDGLYSLRLVVVKNDPANPGGPFLFETSVIQVTVDNQAPTISLISPTPGQEYTLGQDESVIIQAQVSDNLSIARVAFFVDNISTESATVPPYSTRWKLTGAGEHVIFARVYDAAGNFVDSEKVTIGVK
jgi:membrane peptidoglycan carboxypeptidase